MGETFQVSLTIRVLDLQVHVPFEFQVAAQLDFLCIILNLLPLDCCIFALNWLPTADNLSLYLIAVAAIHFLRYLLSASGMMPIPILVIT